MEQLLVALDVDTAADALVLADRLRGVAGGFKIGNRLFTSHGPAFVSDLVSRGDRVFLDLKYHDIPNTVAGAVAAAARLGVWMINVHAAGGLEMMRAARDAAAAEASRLSRRAPLVIAVTMLTSLSQDSMADIGMTGSLPAQVDRLAALAQSAGLDGVVASAQEIALIRGRCGPSFTIVTPGIRGGSATVRGAVAPGVIDDQARTMSASEALAAGASYLVVGRPIIAAADPRRAAEDIAAECRAAMTK